MYTHPSEPTPALEQVVAAFLKKTRRDYGLTLQDVAEAGTQHGARWHKSSVNNIEQGAAALTLNLLIPLCQGLSDLTGEQISVLDLLGDEEQVTVHRNSPVKLNRRKLKTALVGSRTHSGATDHLQFNPAEMRAAAKLDVTTLELRHLALECFQAPLHIHLTQILGPDPAPYMYSRRFNAAVEVLKRHLSSKSRSPHLVLSL